MLINVEKKILVGYKLIIWSREFVNVHKKMRSFATFLDCCGIRFQVIYLLVLKAICCKMFVFFGVNGCCFSVHLTGQRLLDLWTMCFYLRSLQHWILFSLARDLF
jgi:hypothetical protein